MAKHHHLPAAPETAHWGFLDPKLKPVLTIDSGDRVTIDTVSGNPEHVPPKARGFQILPEHLEIHRKVTKGTGNHIYTGPVSVDGAEPGNVLEVRVLDIALRQDWGWNAFRPLVGTLPDDFPYLHVIHHLALDRQAMTATTPWGLKLPIRPFFGQLAVAPRPEFGRQNSKEPREFGGNLDCKDLAAGSTIYLPVWTAGALFSTGDGHALQGDGEVCGTAIETALTGTFEFVVRKDLTWRMPRAETPTHLITIGLDWDLDNAVVQALRTMIDWLGALLRLSREDAYHLCSFVCDLHVTQTVNNVKGIHAMVEKRVVGLA
ncbi:MAG: acetamidase/formamidase family protein [Candidatus Rokuibacteriota bacterium]